MLLPPTFSYSSPDIPNEDQIGLEWRKIVLGYWYDGMLDSSIWCGSTMSSLEYAPSMLTRCFLVDLSALGLSEGEPESSVGVSWWDERDLIERLFAGAHSFGSFFWLKGWRVSLVIRFWASVFWNCARNPRARYLWKNSTESEQLLFFDYLLRVFTLGFYP